MKKAVIIFHSVCGNDYLVAKKFSHELECLGMEAALYRVPDREWVEKPDLSVKARESIRAMRALPEATPQALLDADLVVMGTPTYFGNVSAPMKAYMDATGSLWVKALLAGKKFMAFTSAGNTEGGGDLCLQALHTYAKYMGMWCVPMPVTTIPGEHTSALGVIHYSNGQYGEILDVKTERVITGFCAIIYSAIKDLK